jgi:hypothetical protein
MVNAHEVFLRGPGVVARAPGSPLILQRTEQDFLRATLSELGSEHPRDAVAASIASAEDERGILRLFQPVHRTFHVTVLDLACAVPGQPRVDPRKIESAGLVVRRLRDNIKAPFGEAWMEDARALRGWIPLRTEAEAAADPDPQRRFAAGTGRGLLAPKVAQLRADRELLRESRPGPLTEQVTPLFVAPPAVCGKSGRTLLYGIVPTASAEVTDMPAPLPAAGASGGRVYAEDEMREHFPGFLRAGMAASLEGIADGTFTHEAAAEVARGSKQMETWLTFLRQLLIQLDVFGAAKPAKAFYDELQKISLSVAGQSRLAGEYLKEAAAVLAVPGRAGDSVRLPERWPQIPTAQSERLYTGFATLLETRFLEMAPHAPRFDGAGIIYELRAFVRLRRDDGCPPELVWSAPSRPFVIVPWYERGGVAPVQIELPSITSKNVAKLKPNVAFKVPGSLFNLLQKNTPKQFLDGKAEEGDDGGIQWICGFNIPIITMCAFIVLFIFLTLLHIVFWWLPFIRICFPLPRLRR